MNRRTKDVNVSINPRISTKTNYRCLSWTSFSPYAAVATNPLSISSREKRPAAFYCNFLTADEKTGGIAMLSRDDFAVKLINMYRMPNVSYANDM